jgi:hypothetical protein
MLVYIRRKDMPKVLCDFKETDIPISIRERIKRDEAARKEEEASLIEEGKKISFKFFSDKQLVDHHGIELSPASVTVKVLKDAPFENLVKVQSCVTVVR